MYDLIAILIPVILAVCIVVSIRIVTDARIKRQLIESGSDDALARTILASDAQSQRRSSLKWSLVLLMFAAAFTAIWAFGIDAESPLSYALVFASAGIALLLFRRLEPPQR
jgi:hypothetical protein